jgi:hypothetical protein
MRKFAAARDWHPQIPEDMYYSMKCTEDKDCTVCPPDVAANFVIEKDIDGNKSQSAPWAFHKNIKYGGKAICDFNERLAALQKSELPSATARAAPDVVSWEPRLGPSGAAGR